MGSRWVAAFAVALSSLPAAVPAVGQVTFDDVVSRRRPHPEEVEVERLLAEAARAAAGGGALPAEGATASLEAGPRNAGDDTEPDLAIGIELPLLAGREERRALADMLPAAAAAMRAAARATADAELTEAFVAAWLAQAIVELREQDVETAESWLSAARRRAEAGADAPYEPTLVAGERDRAAVELVEARRDLELAWGGLKALSEVPPRPSPLSPDGLPRGRAAVPIDGTPTPASLRAGIEARRGLALALARTLASAVGSRWALAGSVAREGEERLAHVGVAYRFPLRGEIAAISAELAAAEAQAAHAAALRLAEAEARVAAAASTLRSASPLLEAADLDRTQAALAVRVEEGKERPSQVLPLRRQVLEARIAALRARAAQMAAAAQLHFLAGEAGR